VSAANAVLKSLLEPAGGALLALPPGYGKTVVALYIMAKLKKTSLVVIPAGHIAQQWVERIETYLPNAKVGHLHGIKPFIF
jgi:superfamily II DNA or RNA helicase